MFPLEQHHSRQCPDGAGHARPDPAARSRRGAPGRRGWAGVSVRLQPPITFWSQNTAKIRSSACGSAAWRSLKGLKIVHVYVDKFAGRETMPILDLQAARYGFTVQHLAVQLPGLDQKATWLRVKVAQPDRGHLAQLWRCDMDGPEGSGPGRRPPRQDHRAARDLRGAGHGASRGGGHWLHLRHLVGHGRTSRSSRRYASTFMPEARGGGRQGRTGPWMRGRCAACSRRRRCARPCASSGIRP